LPIYLDWLEQPKEQDLVDLDKLFDDAPDDWLTDEGQHVNAHWALQQIASNKKLALGRFNDRVVSAVWLVKQSEDASQPYQYEIDKLCVRKITRQRGVAKQLLVRLCQWANQQGCDLYVADADNRLAGLYELGFVQHAQGWRYSARVTV